MSASAAGRVMLAVASLSFSPLASAQDEAAAQALFDKGITEMEAGNFDSACPAIAESLRLDRRAGTLFTLAECEGKAGKTASAVTHYQEYLSVFSKMTSAEQKKQRGRDAVAEKALRDLSPRVPKLTLRLPKDAPEGARVERDGVALGAAALGVALPTDPGEHVIRVHVGEKMHEQRVSLAEGEAKELTLGLPDAASAAPVNGDTTAAPVTADTASGGGNTLAWVAGGIGLAALVVGSVTGAMVFGKKSTIDEHCDGSVCDQTGKDAADSAHTLGTVSTIGFGIGIAGLATAGVLFLTAGKSKPESGKGARSFVSVGFGGVW
jgi:hypothetical protein